MCFLVYEDMKQVSVGEPCTLELCQISVQAKVKLAKKNGRWALLVYIGNITGTQPTLDNALPAGPVEMVGHSWGLQIAQCPRRIITVNVTWLSRVYCFH